MTNGCDSSSSDNKPPKDKIFSRLLACNGNIKCINKILECCGISALTLEEIGDILHITRERVRQIEATALKKTRNPRFGRKLREYLMQ